MGDWLGNVLAYVYLGIGAGAGLLVGLPAGFVIGLNIA